jgi:hypothetical protein
MYIRCATSLLVSIHYYSASCKYNVLMMETEYKTFLIRGDAYPCKPKIYEQQPQGFVQFN